MLTATDQPTRRCTRARVHSFIQRSEYCPAYDEKAIRHQDIALSGTWDLVIVVKGPASASWSSTRTNQ